MNFFAFVGAAFLALDPSCKGYLTYQLIKQLSVAPMYFIYALYLASGFVASPGFFTFLVRTTIDLVFFVPLLVLTFGGVHPAHVLCVRQFFHYFKRYLEESTLPNFAQSISERPARLIAASFLGLIAIGAFLLVLPVSVAAERSPSFITALFTATSAVCVTGLTVVDTGFYFSQFGQLIILALIQIGGFGIMTLSACAGYLIGKKLGMSERSVLQTVLDATDQAALHQILREILKWTLLIESVGALILSLRFALILNCSMEEAIYLGIFHSVSAFCNAGFSLFSKSLMDFRSDPVINFAVAGLIITGGLGFNVLSAINGFLLGRRRLEHDVHSLLTIGMTGILLILGTVVFLVLELHGRAMQGLSPAERLMAAFFASVTARTAGFNTIDYALLSPASLFFTIILMFIGGSSGSTAGGIKTTTLAVILLALDSEIRREPFVVFKERNIPTETVRRAFVISTLAAGMIATATFVLIALENQPLLPILFEVVSAFGTVGLSTGITADLTTIGKIVLILLMFVGRIGPLTLALSIRSKHENVRISYPNTRVMVG